ncbi:MAG: glycosyltransferase family 2 protein [Candidatus Omnitrophica bacterium]|nr:glycosyltransferase family 2 protein [Candidatus Omnitrophota bacterium]MCK5180229.1 glycosyltransferase family 2 protein [Candidatus Omnitrophota bacterium]MCK5259583.1 glycosyltransferase family 2 protein [Candidatus Omnitrophota bacterium]
MDISVIIPVYNENQNVPILYKELNDVLPGLNKEYEIIFINDGSTDNTLKNLKDIYSKDRKVRIIDLKRNFGQTAAIAAGFELAEGGIVITMDGDLQNDPHDIPRFLEEINKGFDIVSGWRKKRKDFFLRVILSRIASCLISKILGLKLHDYGCTLKAYQKKVIKDINLYGDMHRFIPAVASSSGAKIAEIEVNHRPRKYEQSKYNLNRIIKVSLDLLLLAFLSEYHTKPIRFFGGLGIISFLLGTFSIIALIYMKVFSGIDMTGNPLIILATLFILVSMQFISIGFVSEINIRTYYESQNKKIYSIKEII